MAYRVRKQKGHRLQTQDVLSGGQPEKWMFRAVVGVERELFDHFERAWADHVAWTGNRLLMAFSKKRPCMVEGSRFVLFVVPIEDPRPIEIPNKKLVALSPKRIEV